MSVRPNRKKSIGTESIGARSAKEAREAADRLALGGERILDRRRIGPAERHAAHELLVRRRTDVLDDDAVKLGERGLRAGVQTTRTRRDHDALQEHPVVEP